MFDPFGQCCFQKFAAQLIALQPDRLEHRQHFQRIVNEFRSRTFGRRGGQWTVQQPQSGFAMITARGAKLIEDEPPVRTTGALIAAVNAGQGLAFGG